MDTTESMGFVEEDGLVSLGGMQLDDGEDIEVEQNGERSTTPPRVPFLRVLRSPAPMSEVGTLAFGDMRSRDISVAPSDSMSRFDIFIPQQPGLVVNIAYHQLHAMTIQILEGPQDSRPGIAWSPTASQMLDFRVQFKYHEYLSIQSGYIWRTLPTIDPNII